MSRHRYQSDGCVNAWTYQSDERTSSRELAIVSAVLRGINKGPRGSSGLLFMASLDGLSLTMSAAYATFPPNHPQLRRSKQVGPAVRCDSLVECNTLSPTTSTHVLILTLTLTLTRAAQWGCEYMAQVCGVPPARHFRWLQLPQVQTQSQQS